MKRDLLSPLDLSAVEMKKIFERAAWLKKTRKRGRVPATLRGKTLGMIFEKPSTRTQVSFDVAMWELGGHSVSLNASSSQLGRGETYADTGRVLSRYVHGIMIRTFAQAHCEELARAASVPVINGLTDEHHPCQILTDLFTIQELRKDLRKTVIAYVGDGNNMANSWMEAALVLGFPLRIGTPAGFEPSGDVLKRIDRNKARTIVLTRDPIEAISGADVVNTDTWFSMGQEVSEEKRRAFEPFQVNARLLKHARKDAVVLHCLPAHRGEEVTDEVMDGPQSRVFDQAENRLHVQKAILEMLLR
ncbi:MAG TPA: ornithine carbamoyltransferase [bacterium]|nr:ornithine carbamoyltransferase [bacterium]